MLSPKCAITRDRSMFHVNGICPYSKQFPLKYYVSIMAPIKWRKNIESGRWNGYQPEAHTKFKLHFTAGTKGFNDKTFRGVKKWIKIYFFLHFSPRYSSWREKFNLMKLLSQRSTFYPTSRHSRPNIGVWHQSADLQRGNPWRRRRLLRMQHSSKSLGVQSVLEA